MAVFNVQFIVPNAIAIRIDNIIYFRLTNYMLTNCMRQFFQSDS
jgi:hypothetical protein